MKISNILIEEDNNISHASGTSVEEENAGAYIDIGEYLKNEDKCIYGDTYWLAKLFEAKTRAEFTDSLQEIIRKFGFKFYCVELFWAAPIGKPLRDMFTSYPQHWQQLYENRNYAAVDPAVAHCMSAPSPIYWNEKNYSNANCSHIYETARNHGISAGISVAIHQYGGSRTMVSLSLEKQPHELSEKEINGLKQASQVLAGCIHAVAGRFTKDPVNGNDLPKLTAREVECLEWVAAGKTAWETAAILGVTEATATFHVKNVIRKLKASNRQHALALAFHYGILK